MFNVVEETQKDCEMRTLASALSRTSVEAFRHKPQWNFVENISGQIGAPCALFYCLFSQFLLKCQKSLFPEF